MVKSHSHVKVSVSAREKRKQKVSNRSNVIAATIACNSKERIRGEAQTMKE